MHCEEVILEDVARLESKLKAVRRKGNLTVESQICNLLGKKYELLGEWKEALTFHYFDSEIGAAMDDYEGQMVALNNMALVYRRLDLTAKAKEVYKRMLSVADKAPKFAQKKCLSGVVDACIGLGSIGLEKSEKHPKIIREELTRKAFASFERALSAAKKHQSLIDEGLIGQTAANKQDALEMEIKVLNGMGLFYAHSDTPKDALSFYDRAISKATLLETFDEGLGHMWAFRALEGKGRALGRAKEWSKAVELCFDVQLTLAKEQLEDDQVAEAQYNLAEACFFLGDYALAKSTALTCIDTIKVRCMDQTKSVKAEALMCKIFEAMEWASDLESLETKISRETDEPSLVDYLFQAGRLLKKLERINEAYQTAKRIPPFLERGTYGRVIKKKVYQLVTSLAVQQKAWSDAMFYGRKWLETLEDHQDDALVDCLLKLVEAHVESNSIDRGILGHLERCHDLLTDDPSKELQCLSFLSLVHDHLGNPEDANRFRDECFGLALAIQNESEDALGKDYQEIEMASYFGDRKVSRTTKSLMGGDFQMKTRTSKAGAIAKRRVKASNITGPVCKTAAKRTKTTKVVYENLESASDLEDFIASSSESEKENSDRRKRGKRQKDRVSVFLSSDIESPLIEDAFASVSISASQKERAFDEPYVDPSFAEAMNDHGPIGWDDSPAFGDYIEAPYKQLALRIRIQVADHVLVVPCFDDDITERKKISWLIKEASKRYAELDEKEPVIKALSYLNSDAFLSPNDPVALVLTDGQTVKAHIDGWRQRSWLQEYQYQMQRLDIASVEFLEQAFAETPSDSGRFDFSYADFDTTCTALLVATLKAKRESFTGFELDLTGATHLCFSALDIKLSGLNVSFMSLSETEERALLSLIQANAECLKDLNLSFMQTSEGFVSHVLKLLSKYGLTSMLQRLDLSGHTLPDDADLESLHFLSNLHELYLEACVMNTAHIEGLCKFIPKSSTIQRLSLQATSNAEVLLLSDAVTQSFSLHALDLLDTRPEIISIFVSSLSSSTCLRELECNKMKEDCKSVLLARGISVKTHYQL